MQKISDDVNSQTKHLGPEKNWIESNIKHLKVSKGFEAIANCYKWMIKKQRLWLLDVNLLQVIQTYFKISDIIATTIHSQALFESN